MGLVKLHRYEVAVIYQSSHTGLASSVSFMFHEMLDGFSVEDLVFDVCNHGNLLDLEIISENLKTSLSCGDTFKMVFTDNHGKTVWKKVEVLAVSFNVLEEKEI
jgi:hypothetical protein